MVQLKRDDWLEHGLEQLTQVGVERLTIDSLCQQLGVTKGSFYHHFKNHRAYLTAILEYWEETYTMEFIEYSQMGLTPEEQIARLNERVMQTFGEHENHIRAWAQTDPLAREFQARVDRRRIDYLRQLYTRWLDDKQAEAMANLTYTALIGSTSLIPPLARQEYEQMTQLMTRMLRDYMEGDQT